MSTSPIAILGKSVAAHTTTTRTTIESPILTTEPEVILPPLHVASQRGDLGELQRLLTEAKETGEEGGGLANDRDAQNITSLHWASINNQVLACKILLESGAIVDAQGGDLNATPLQWAAR
jgi:ankyrin repeat protein